LADGIGNLLSRSLTMIDRFAGGKIPAGVISADGALERELATVTGEAEAEADDHIQHLRFSRALESVAKVIQLCDQYIDKTAPWVLAKKVDERLRLDNVLFHIANTLSSLVQFLYPFMPAAAEQMAEQIGLGPRHDGNLLTWRDLRPGTVVKKAAPLFPRIDLTKQQGASTVSDTQPSSPLPGSPVGPSSPAAAATASSGSVPATTDQITIDEFQKIQLKTAKVLTAERVPKSEKLIKLQVDLGTEQRQIVAGIGKKYQPEELIGKTIVIVANLKPAKLMGVESQGMVLAAGDAEVTGLVTILESAEPGTKVK
jgi:methionyl-tRNA synthetase